MDQNDGVGRPPLEAAAVADRKLVAHFKAHFEKRLRAGESPAIAKYLARAPERLRPEIERELAALVTSVPAAQVQAELQTKQPAPQGTTAGEFRSTQVRLLAGEVRTFGSYELLQELGRGGMGVVYKARHVGLNRTVALKMLLTGSFAGQEELQRFQAEVEAAAMFEHPHIVPLYEVGEHRQFRYFSMAYVEGRSLQDLIRAQPLPARRAAQFIRHVADAVEYAHGKGVFHRDLKPSNILVDKHDQPRVTDFGLAKRTNSQSELTQTGQVLGTPSFMPPEQALGKHSQLTAAADVYSLGATLYALVIGRPPFHADTIAATLTQVVNEMPVRPRLLNAQIDRDLETIILKCLEKPPAARYLTAGELRDDLQRYLTGHPISARPVGRVLRSWRWCLRNRAFASLLATLVGITVIGFAAATLVAISMSRLAADKTRLATEKTQLATEKTDLATEKTKLAEDALRSSDLANRKSVEASLQRAFALRAAHEPGYREQFKQSVRAAVLAPDGPADSQQLEAEVMACLSDPFGMPELTKDELSKVAPFSIGSGSSDRSGPQSQRYSNPAAEFQATISRFQVVVTKNAERPRELDPQLGVVVCIVFDPNEPLIAIGCDEGVAIYSLTDFSKIFWYRSTTTYQIAFSPDSCMLAVMDLHGQVDVWSIRSNRHYFKPKFTGGRTRLAFSTNGDCLLRCNSENQPVQGWSITQTPERRLLMAHRGGVTGIQFRGDGKQVASCSKDGKVCLWDTASGRLEHRLTAPETQIQAVCYSPDGALVLSGDWSNGNIAIWRSDNGKPVSGADALTKPGFVSHLAFSPNGRQLLAAARSRLYLWDLKVAGAELIATQRAAVPIGDGLSFALSPQGDTAVALSPAGDLWLLRGPEFKIECHQKLSLNVRFQTVGYSHDGARIVVLLRNGQLAEWDVMTQKLVDARRTPLMGVDSFWYVPASGLVAAIDPTVNQVVVYSLAHDQVVCRLPRNDCSYWYAAFSPGGSQLALGTVDGSIQVWNMEATFASIQTFGLQLPFAFEKPAVEAQLPPDLLRMDGVTTLRIE